MKGGLIQTGLPCLVNRPRDPFIALFYVELCFVFPLCEIIPALGRFRENISKFAKEDLSGGKTAIHQKWKIYCFWIPFPNYGKDNELLIMVKVKL